MDYSYTADLRLAHFRQEKEQQEDDAAIFDNVFSDYACRNFG